ncbi:UNVERIFIED_CONTAM: hypothetical protein FKN15_029229 [Acipenser sinensis]
MPRAVLSSDAVAVGGYMVSLQCVKKRTVNTPVVWPGVCGLACKLPRAVLSSDAVAVGGYMCSCKLFLDQANVSFGRPGVECYCQHDNGAAVIQLQFLINEVSNSTAYLWGRFSTGPCIWVVYLCLHSKLITFCHLPFQSKWFYVGTERGNIHIVNVESFTLSGYVIMWNKAIELYKKAQVNLMLLYENVSMACVYCEETAMARNEKRKK